ncbi:hypothetical protein AVEN_114475-1 [Araneus ventricosus]|uniref:Uncharacterized protein n=1 Tax=Araneus ventricosus TaxID=182803 RepID=A0A4Y2I4I2_ARAVE|nr:hypothetical protein AVEN_114475-1 [Araneus ventricosus]
MTRQVYLVLRQRSKRTFICVVSEQAAPMADSRLRVRFANLELRNFLQNSMAFKKSVYQDCFINEKRKILVRSDFECHPDSLIYHDISVRFHINLNGGHGGLVVRCRPRSLWAPGSNPDSIEDPSCIRGLFWYPRLGWETSLFPHVNKGKSDVSQPNRGYQNRPVRLVEC